MVKFKIHKKSKQTGGGDGHVISRGIQERYVEIPGIN